jgi:hypothetical protein
MSALPNAEEKAEKREGAPGFWTAYLDVVREVEKHAKAEKKRRK